MKLNKLLLAAIIAAPLLTNVNAMEDKETKLDDNPLTKNYGDDEEEFFEEGGNTTEGEQKDPNTVINTTEGGDTENFTLKMPTTQKIPSITDDVGGEKILGKDQEKRNSTHENSNQDTSESSESNKDSSETRKSNRDSSGKQELNDRHSANIEEVNEPEEEKFELKMPTKKIESNEPEVEQYTKESVAKQVKEITSEFQTQLLEIKNNAELIMQQQTTQLQQKNSELEQKDNALQLKNSEIQDLKSDIQKEVKEKSLLFSRISKVANLFNQALGALELDQFDFPPNVNEYTAKDFQNMLNAVSQFWTKKPEVVKDNKAKDLSRESTINMVRSGFNNRSDNNSSGNSSFSMGRKIKSNSSNQDNNNQLERLRQEEENRRQIERLRQEEENRRQLEENNNTSSSSSFAPIGRKNK